MTAAMLHPALASQPARYRKLHLVMGVLAIVFGIATLKEGGAAIFARQAAGEIVYFVLYFNFAAGFLYIATGAALLMQKRWSIRPATLLAVASLIVLVFLGFHVLLGMPYETRTIIAMTIRTVFWVAFALGLYATTKAVKPGAE